MEKFSNTSSPPIASSSRQLHNGAEIEADLDANDGTCGWIKGIITKAKPGKGSFRAAFRRPQDPVATVLKFRVADEGVEWRWPEKPSKSAAVTAYASGAGGTATSPAANAVRFSGLQSLQA